MAQGPQGPVIPALSGYINLGMYSLPTWICATRCHGVAKESAVVIRFLSSRGSMATVAIQ